MKITTVCFALAALLSATAAHAIGIEEALAPDPDDKSLSVRIWYPSNTNHVNTVLGEHLPLIIISHGTGGGNVGHEDTARVLAESGFVVAAVTHTGDNYKDQSYVRLGKHLIGRPRHITRTIDYMLTGWHAHQQLDPERIGMFGFSAGGFTALVVAGGQPDMTRVAAHCGNSPAAWDCDYLRKNGVIVQSMVPPPASAWIHDPRVKAAVIAAPAVGYSFEPHGLANVRIAIQLWGGERDEVVENSADIVRHVLPAATEYHLVSGAGHYSFLAPCSWQLRSLISVMAWFGTEKICSDPEGFDRQSFHVRFNASVVQFLSTQLPSRAHE